jgi:germination protein M
MAPARKNRKQKSRSGFFFMMIIVALLGIIAWAYRDKFSTMFLTGFQGGREYITERFGSGSEDDNLVDRIRTIERRSTTTTTVERISRENDNDIFVQRRDRDRDIAASTTTTISTNKQVKSVSDNDKANSRRSTIYFTVINDDDTLKLASVSRDISYSNKPLTETVNALLAGPGSTNTSGEIITNIPDGTKLKGAWIKNGVAYLDFSREFEFNNYGRESTMAQLQQVVYTVTEFSTVSQVQFLIDGKVKTYLGGEGVVIGRPLGRNDFS